MMLWVRIFFTVATFTMINTKVIERDIITSRKHAFFQTSDVGVSPQGRSSYVFKVKSCNTAIITLSNIKYIDKTKGRYFLFYLGRNFNTQLSLLDSCFGCPPKAVLRRKVLDCYVFVTFWMQWNDLGSVWFGAGHRVGHGTLLSYTTPIPFSIRYSQVTTLAPPTTWKFLLDEDVRFVTPAPDGSTTVLLRENVAVASFVYEITVRPLVNTILTSSNDYFMIYGNKILTKVPLNFESKQVHFLHLRTTEGGVNTTLTVIIEDVNDEIPEIYVISDVRIPEELPVRSLFSGCFVVCDKDYGDNFIFKLEGADAIYLDVTRNGQLQVKARIDRDGPNGIARLDELILVVEDSSNHTTTRHLAIDIHDVDDNEPTCSPEQTAITINPNMTKEIHVCDVKCSDMDLTNGETFHLRLDRNEDREHAFFVSGTDVYLDADYLRLTFTKNTNLTLVLKLFVVYDSETIEEISFSIIIKVRLEHPEANAYAPYWVSPIPFADRRFLDMEISETTPRGTLIRCLLAYDLDEMPLSYHIATIFTDDGNQANDVFKMDAETGCIRTARILDADRASGGVHFYDVTVKVTDGEHVISALFRVILKNVNDNPPIFKKTIHHASINSKNHLKYLAQFDVNDFDDDSEVYLTLQRGHHRLFQLTSSGGRWKLMLRSGIDSLIAIPSVIRITAKDNWSSQRSSQVVVIMEGLPCQADLSESKSQIGSDIEPNHSHTEVVSTSEPSTTTTFITKSTQTRLEMSHFFKDSIHQEIESMKESPKPSVMRLFLVFVCVCLAVCNGLILTLLMVVLGCRDRSLPKEEHKTKELDKASGKLKHSRETRGTIEIRPGREANVVCLLNIQEETRKVKFRNIKITRKDAHNLKTSLITPRYDPHEQAAVSHIAMGDRKKDICKVSSFDSKDIGIQTYPDENGYKGKHSTLHYMQNGPEASFNEIESVEVMKRHMNVKESFLQLNPFEVKTNHVNVTSDDEPFGANAHYVDVTSDEETLKANANYFPVTSDDDSAHLAEESYNGVPRLSYRPSVDYEINLKGNNGFDDDDELVADGLEPADFDQEDNVYDVSKTGCEDIEEKSSGKYSYRQSPHEVNQTSAAERHFAISNINRCSGNDLDIGQVFRSKQDVECSVLSSKMFRSLLHQDRESKVVEEDILEVNSDFLKTLVVYQGGRVSDVERSLKRFPKKHIRSVTIVYLPRVIFLSFLSQRLNYYFNVDSSCDVVEIQSHFLHTSVAELEKHTLAVCRARGTVFAMRHIAMTFLCPNYRLIEVSVDFLTQLGKPERQAHRFIDENIVALIPSKDSFLVLLNKFLQFVGDIPSERFPNGHMEGQCCQHGHTFHREYVCREIRHHGNIGFVSKGSCSNPYKAETFYNELYSASSFGSSEHSMDFCSYFPPFRSTLKSRTIGRHKLSSSCYSMNTNTYEIARRHQRKASDDIPTFPQLGKSTPARKKTKKPCHYTGLPCTTTTPKGDTRGNELFRAKPGKSFKKKNKIKAWNKDVRDRLYGKANTNKTDKSKGKVSPEN